MQTSYRRRVGVVAAAFGLILTAASLFPAPAQAQAPGNNGTVKIDELDLDGGPGEGPGNSNDPQINGCKGQIEWYGFDEGEQTATVTFTVWPPTAQTAPTAVTVLGPLQFTDIDGDGPGVPSDPGFLDGVMEFDLSTLLEPFEASPQGFHVKVVVVTTLTEGGSDIKHKVFWVADNCQTNLCVDDPDVAGDQCNPCVENCSLSPPPPGVPVASVSESCGSGTVIVLDNRDVDEATTFVATVSSGGQIVEADNVVVAGGTFQELIYTLADGTYTVTVTVDGTSVLVGSGVVEVDCVQAEQVVNSPPPSPPLPAEVLGVVQTQPAALPRTGANTMMLLAAGLVLVVGGTALVLGARLVPEARRA